MENEQREEIKEAQPAQEERPTPIKTAVSPPQPMRKKPGKKGRGILIAILLLIIVVVFLVVRSSGSSDPSSSPTPDSGLTIPSTPVPTATPSVDRDEISIEVLNGTGIAREASFLQGKLANLGYTDIDMGNADDSDNEETKVTFSSSVADSVVDEITEELEDIYKDVKVTTSRSETSVDIEIITGLRKGATPKPSATATPTSSPTSSPTPTETPTPSPT